MERTLAKHVVIGAGAMGSATAYHLALRGEPVVLIEQFALGHDRGSSHGAARIIRHSYADPRYARLMPAAFEAWRDLEADAAQPLYIRTGGVSISPAGVDYVAQVASSLKELGVPHRRMSGSAWNEVNPAFSVPGDYDVVFEPDAGMITAAKAVAIQVELARSQGGERTQVFSSRPVVRIDLTGDRPVVLTDSLAITAERLIVTAGAWVKRLLPELPVPLRVTRQQVLYFRPPAMVPFRIGRFPVFIFKGAEDENAFYGMPPFLDLGVKVARHFGPEIDPDFPDQVIDDDYPDIVRRFLQDHIPGLADAPVDRTETCLYTVAPNEDFLIDWLPGRSDVLVASACSGHGFKFSCLIGRVLAELATDGTTGIPIQAWRIPNIGRPPGT
jgi:sarcosine oxidase